jgi:hypothetical protein
VIPVDSITSKAKISYESQKETTSFRDEIVKELLAWVPKNFFKIFSSKVNSSVGFVFF